MLQREGHIMSIVINTTTKDVLHLEKVYEGRSPLHGEAHDHACTGGTSDGKRTLTYWIGAMDALQMDFAAILDHRQVRHMYLPEWKEALFLCGTEPGGRITDNPAEFNFMHYNLLVPNPAALEDLLEHFPEYEFTGGSEGHFTYPDFTTERFCELLEELYARGGYYVHPHPRQMMRSNNPLDYWFRDWTGMEVFYGSVDNQDSADNYELWTALLALGKHIYAAAGGDGHRACSDKALTTIYSAEKTNEEILTHMRAGDTTCGAVGIRMCMGETRMGGCCSFEKNRLYFCVGDFHRSVRMPEHKYRVDLLDDKGVVFSAPILCTHPSYFALDAKACRFYRVEVWDETRSIRIAIGNPIWNTDDLENKA